MTIVKWTGLEATAMCAALRDVQVQFAERIGCSVEAVGKWKRRGASITLQAKYSECMDTLLGRLDDEQRARFEAAIAISNLADNPRQSAQPPLHTTFLDYELQEDDDVKRREFGTAALGLAALVAGSPEPARRAAPELVDYYRSQLQGHYSTDRFSGPQQLITIAIPQYELLCGLANAADGSLRREFWSLAASFAAFVGWLYQDAGDMRRATHWLDAMLERAHRSQDIQLVGFALHNKAMLQADMKDGRGALDLTGAALQQRARLCPKVEVLLLQQAAHGTSLIGDDDAVGICDKLLDEADTLLTNVDDEYPWGACRSPRYIDIQRATVWTRLGRAPEAIRLWDDIIPDIPVSESRDRGVFSARHAQALAAAGQPEQAVATVAAIPPLAITTGSARMRSELFTLRKRMQPWSLEPSGRELAELLSDFPKESKTEEVETWHHETMY